MTSVADLPGVTMDRDHEIHAERRSHRHRRVPKVRNADCTMSKYRYWYLCAAGRLGSTTCESDGNTYTLTAGDTRAQFASGWLLEHASRLDFAPS